jgi:hypothetical protein
MPSALNARATNHPILAEQPTGLPPLAADTMEQAVLIRFFIREDTVFMPNANHAVSAAIAQRHDFTKLAVPMKGFFNDLFHDNDGRFAANEAIKCHPAVKSQPGIAMTHKIHFQEKADSRDENLEAKLPGGGGRVKEERKRERLSERPVVP